MKRSKQARNAQKGAQRAETMPPRVSKYAAKKAARNGTQPRTLANKQAGYCDIYLIRKIMIGITVFGLVSIAFNIARMLG